MAISTITSKGQTTIPKEIRDLLGLKEQAQVIYEPKGDYVILRSASISLDEFAGALRSSRHAASKKEARLAVGKQLGQEIDA